MAFGLDIALSSKQRADWSALVIAVVDAMDRHVIVHAVRWRADWPTTFQKVLDAAGFALIALDSKLRTGWASKEDRWGMWSGALPHEQKDIQIGGKYVWQIHGYETKAQYLEACAKEEAQEEVYEPLPLTSQGYPVAEHNPDLPVSYGVLTTCYMPLADGSQALHGFRDGKWERL
ncbi:MAG: hypothetical protein WB586_28655 [Chthoniobacterales bacterium]